MFTPSNRPSRSPLSPSSSAQRARRLVGGVAMLASLSACGGGDKVEDPAPTMTDTNNATAFKASSPDLVSGSFSSQFLLKGFGCTGGNVSPRVEWSNAPAGTKAFAVTVLDMDAPTGSGLWHWAVYDIPASATALPQGAGNAAASLPTPAYGGTSDLTGTGVAGTDGSYAGPCPPVGDAPHRYVFTVYAYGVQTLADAGGIPKASTAGLYGFVLNKGLGNGLLGKTSFIATYGR